MNSQRTAENILKAFYEEAEELGYTMIENIVPFIVKELDATEKEIIRMRKESDAIQAEIMRGDE